MTRSNSARTSPASNPVLIRGFCTNAEAEAILLVAGIPENDVWRRGRDVESIEWAIASFRKRPGILYVSEGLEMFGETRDEIFAQTSLLHRNRIELVRAQAPYATPMDLIHDAQKYLSAKNAMKDPRTAKKRGRLGGTAKGIAAQMKREAMDRDGVLTRLFNHPKITFRLALEIAGPTVKPSSARRHFKR